MTMAQSVLHKAAVGVGVAQNPENLNILAKPDVQRRFGSAKLHQPFKSG